MTFSVLRALHGIIGDALDQIESVYAYHESQLCSSKANNLTNASQTQHSQSTQQQQPSHHRVTSLSKIYASPPPSPCIHSSFAGTSPSPTKPAPPPAPASPPQLDFPSLDAFCDPTSLSETLTQHPDVISASNRIIAACGQMAVTLQTPFMSLCDAIMQYHLPSCLRLFEASNTPEILREGGSLGLHVDVIAHKTRVEKTKLAHILRLLATHHIIREVSPDVFALNRISSIMDTGKDFWDLQKWIAQGTPEKKYEDTSGVAAFVGLCTDEIFKASAFLTETYLSSSKSTRAAKDPTKAPFCIAFDSQTEYFGWLEGGGGGGGGGKGRAESHSYSDNSRLGKNQREALYIPDTYDYHPNPNRFRLERFGKAMSSTPSWETPDAILNSFDWHALPRNSTIVDVGGGVGSTSMLLAKAFSEGQNDLGLRFVIQDRQGTIEIGEKIWKEKCPEFLENGTARFQAHDFFTPQPPTSAAPAPAVYLLRVVLHDWPDHVARRILLHLREAAGPDTKLLLGDFILPLACAYDTCEPSHASSGGGGFLDGIQGLESMLAPPPAPLLSNLGKANSVPYWMDLTMGVMFNAQERTLQEIVKLVASTGWKVTRVTKCSRSLFGYIVAVVDTLPPPPPPPAALAARMQKRYRPSLPPPLPQSHGRLSTSWGPHYHHEGDDGEREDERDWMERRLPASSSRYGIPVFDAPHIQLPPFTQELPAWFDDRGGECLHNPVGTVDRTMPPPPTPSVATAVPKKRPSPLSLTSSTISSQHHQGNTRVAVVSPSPPPPPPPAAAAAVHAPSIKKQKSISKWSSLMNLRALASGVGGTSTAPSKSLQAPTPSSPRSPLTPTSPPPPPHPSQDQSQPHQKTTTTQGLPRKKSLSSLVKWRSESQDRAHYPGHTASTTTTLGGSSTATRNALVPGKYGDSSESILPSPPTYHYCKVVQLSGGGSTGVAQSYTDDAASSLSSPYYAKPTMVVHESHNRVMPTTTMNYKPPSSAEGEEGELEEVDSRHPVWRGQQEQEQQHKPVIVEPLPLPPPPPPPSSPPPPTSRGSRLQRIKSVPSLLAKAARQHRPQPQPPAAGILGSEDRSDAASTRSKRGFRRLRLGGREKDMMPIPMVPVMMIPQGGLSEVSLLRAEDDGRVRVTAAGGCSCGGGGGEAFEKL